MNLWKKYFSKKSPSPTFKSILIISYGRSGSTLLQGLLNSMDGIMVRGENMNMCFHLFQAYQAIMQSKTQSGQLSQNPFYGAELLDEEYFLTRTKETVRSLLLANFKNDSKVKCYGFKEVRYSTIHNDLPEYLEFLEKIFPHPAFLFNTRNKEDVLKSLINAGWYAESNKDEVLEELERTEDAFFKALIKHNNSFHITYEDVVMKSERLKSMYAFLGAHYDEEKIDNILSLRHSYKPNQKTVDLLPLKPRTK